MKQAVNNLVRELCYSVDYGSEDSRYTVMKTGGGNQSKAGICVGRYIYTYHLLPTIV